MHLQEIFDFTFNSSKALLWSPDSCPKLFSYMNLILPRYSNSKIILHIIRTHGNNFFVKIEQNSNVFLVSLRASSSPSLYFLKYSSVLVISFRIFDIIWARSLKTLSKSADILRRNGVNLFVKGTVARDFWPLVFFMNRPQMGP